MLSYLNRNIPEDPKYDPSRIIIYRYYQIIVAALFSVGLVLELVVDFRMSSVAMFIALIAAPVLFLVLSLAGISHRLLIALNMIFLFTINEVQILANPTTFHAWVFWVGLSPLLITALTYIRETIFWTVIIVLFIIGNGIYVSQQFSSYDLTLYPHRFVAAGFLFSLMTATIAILFSYVQYRNHKHLTLQNTRLQLLTKEIEKQNQLLKEQHEEISTINNQLEETNQHLEERVAERTEELEEQNRKLIEYAFINSHLLRGPLSSILGLINLLHSTPLSKQEQEIIGHLKGAGQELDDVISKINKALDSGHTFDRDVIQRLK